MISFQKLVSPFARFFARKAEYDEQFELPSTDGSVHPWQSNLDRLAERGNEPREIINPVNDVEAQFLALMEQAKQEKLKIEAEHGIGEQKRKADNTVVDAKAWWGQSVATWEPLDGKNMNSFGHQRQPRQSKWFDGK
jgi:hypothetical protein